MIIKILKIIVTKNIIAETFISSRTTLYTNPLIKLCLDVYCHKETSSKSQTMRMYCSIAYKNCNSHIHRSAIFLHNVPKKIHKKKINFHTEYFHEKCSLADFFFYEWNGVVGIRKLTEVIKFIGPFDLIWHDNMW